MAAQGLSGAAVAATLAGIVFIYSGIKGQSILKAVQSVVQGKNPATVPQTVGITPLSVGIAPMGGAAAPAGSGPTGGGGTPAANQALAQMLAAPYGWNTGTQWSALAALWERESSWSQIATNPASGAYGIPQALPYTKMPKAAWPASAGGSSDPATQIRWGLSYIAGRYGTPVKAEAHENANGWY